MKTNLLRKMIYQLLSNVAPTYSTDAIPSTRLNHITYYLNSIDLYPERNDETLNIQCWSNNNSECEDMADQIISLLNYKSINNQNITATFYLENKNTINDNDIKISRRDLRFHVMWYERII